MKKTLALILALAMLMGCAALAEEDPRAGLAQLTLKVKTLLDISDEYTSFESNYSYRGNEVIWNLDWEGEGKSLYVSCDGQGKIYDYYRYETDMYMGGSSFAPRLPSGGAAAMEEAADAFLTRVLGENEGYQIASRGSYFAGEGYPDYSFSGLITRGGIPTETDFYLTLRGQDLTVTNFSRGDSYMTFTSRADVSGEIFGQEAAQTRLEGAYIVDLRYISDGSNGVRLAYVPVPRGGWVLDAVTGEVISHGENDFRMYASAGAGDGEMTSDKGLTPAEIEGIEKLEGVKSQAELDRAVRGMAELGVTDDFRITGSSFSVSGDRVEASLYYNRGDTDKYVTLDARDMSLRTVYTSGPWMGEIQYSPDLSEGKNLADAFLEKYFPDLSGHIVFSGSSVPERPWRPVATFTYARQENGIRYDDNEISVDIDTDSGLVDGVTLQWSDDLEFPAPRNLASPEAASAAYFALARATLCICHFYDSEDDTWQEKLCYRLETEHEISGLDASTLAPIMPDVTEHGEIRYEDEAGDAALRLAELGIGFGGGTFSGDRAATLRDALTLVLTSGGVSAIGVPDDRLLEYAFQNRLIARGEYDLSGEITRAAFARLLIEVSGYGKAASVPGIYVCGFADEDQIAPEDLGFVAIARGMGIATPDENGFFYPLRSATRAEIVDMTYAFLTREY